MTNELHQRYNNNSIDAGADIPCDEWGYLRKWSQWCCGFAMMQLNQTADTGIQSRYQLGYAVFNLEYGDMGTMDHDNPTYLAPTEIIDSDHHRVLEYAEEKIGGSNAPVEQAVKLYLAVRDGIRYDPYSPFHLPEHYRASSVLERGRSFCVPKVSLLCALGRACSIPSRVGFATVKNHLATKRLIEFLGSNVFVYHGFVEFHLEGKWVKATPAFNRELCARHKVEPLEFNGREDSLFHPFNREDKKYMEYVEYHGTYGDIPVDAIVAAWKKTYGADRVEGWIEMFAQQEKPPFADFDKEDVWQG